MMVIKLGGSVYHTDYLEEWLNAIARLKSASPVIVPGGGIFADQVRAATQRFSVSEATSHKMALLAMQQYGELLCGLNANFLMANMSDFDRVRADGSVPVWAAFADTCQWFDGPQTWQSTSDSLSLWLATRLGSDKVIVVKSADFDLQASFSKLVEAGVLDAQFIHFATRYQGIIKLMHVSEPAQLADER